MSIEELSMIGEILYILLVIYTIYSKNKYAIILTVGLFLSSIFFYYYNNLGTKKCVNINLNNLMIKKLHN